MASALLRTEISAPVPSAPATPELEKLGWHAGTLVERKQLAAVLRIKALWGLDCFPLAVCGFGEGDRSANKQTIVLAASSLVAFLARHKMFDASPLLVRQFSPNQDRPPQLRS